MKKQLLLITLAAVATQVCAAGGIRDWKRSWGLGPVVPPKHAQANADAKGQPDTYQQFEEDIENWLASMPAAAQVFKNKPNWLQKASDWYAKRRAMREEKVKNLKGKWQELNARLVDIDKRLAALEKMPIAGQELEKAKAEQAQIQEKLNKVATEQAATVSDAVESASALAEEFEKAAEEKPMMDINPPMMELKKPENEATFKTITCTKEGEDCERFDGSAGVCKEQAMALMGKSDNKGFVCAPKAPLMELEKPATFKTITCAKEGEACERFDGSKGTCKEQAMALMGKPDNKGFVCAPDEIEAHPVGHTFTEGDALKDLKAHETEMLPLEPAATATV